MREWVRVFVAACFYYSGLVRLMRWLRWRKGPYLIILNYHRASGGDLRRQMLYLRREYRILPLEEALKELYDSPQPEGKSQFKQRPPLVLTFDDGYRDNYTIAFELARQLHIPITIFLVPGYVESGKPFWWIEEHQLAQWTPIKRERLGRLDNPLNNHPQGDLLAYTLKISLRSAPTVAQREAFLDRLRQTLSLPTISSADQGALPLHWAEIEEMAESGWVTFGAHSMNHPVLSALVDPLERQEEIAKCRQIIEQHTGVAPQTFAYPIGKAEHIGKEAISAVEQAGYTWALTTIEGVNTSQVDPYLLRRLPGVIEQHWLVMASELVGLLGIFSHKREKIWHLH